MNKKTKDDGKINLLSSWNAKAFFFVVRTYLNKKIWASWGLWLTLLSFWFTIISLIFSFSIGSPRDYAMPLALVLIGLLSCFNLIFLYIFRTQNIYQMYFEKALNCMHIGVAHGIRRISQDIEEDNLEMIEKHIRELLRDWKAHAGETFFEQNIFLTVKYTDEPESVKPIRLDSSTREDEPEKYRESYVFKRFEQGEFRSFIYVRNIDKLTRSEALILGDAAEDIVERARKKGYKTFLALPINRLSRGKKNINEHQFVGMLGIDSPVPYSLGHINQTKLDLIGGLIDLLGPGLLALKTSKTKESMTFPQFMKGVKTIQKLEKDLKNKRKILSAMEQDLISKLEALKRGKRELSEKKKQK